MHSNGIDKEIENIVLNLYGIKCKVEYKEDVNEDIINEQKKYLEDLERTACEDLMNEIKLQDEIMEQKEKESNEVTDEDVGKSQLILGRTSKIKERIVKISDLSTDYGRVSLEGEVVSVDSRELKNGKTLAMFNLYDGTSTITCKSFVPEEKTKKVMRKIKKCKKT